MKQTLFILTKTFFYLNKNLKEPFLMFVVPLELCVKCYAFVFKSELLRPSHIPYHITIVITNLKKKNPCLRQEKPFFLFYLYY